jgi:hypothetical protein
MLADARDTAVVQSTNLWSSRLSWAVLIYPLLESELHVVRAEPGGKGTRAVHQAEELTLLRKVQYFAV